MLIKIEDTWVDPKQVQAIHDEEGKVNMIYVGPRWQEVQLDRMTADEAAEMINKAIDSD